MGIQKYQSLIKIILIGVVIGVVHYFVMNKAISSINIESFSYSFFTLYAFFIFLSIIIVGVLIYLSKKHAEQVGYVFLALTSLKMGISYWMMLPIINQSTESSQAEKINFFFIFIVFLSIEVIMTMRLLRDSEK